MTQHNEPIKPCPFCGGDAILIKEDRVWIECADCPSNAEVGPFNTEAEAIAAWNTRPQPTAEPVAKCPTCGEKRLDCYGADEPTQCPKYTLPATLPEPVDDGLVADWLVLQLMQWPDRVDESRTTNIEYLMKSAAATIQRLRGEIARKDAVLRAVTDINFFGNGASYQDDALVMISVGTVRLCRTALNPKETNGG